MQENILTDKHIKLLDRFEKDVAIYDRLAEFSVVMSSIGIICSILIPLTTYSFLIRGNPYDGITVSPYIYFVITGIVVTVLLTRLAIIYADRKKHKISETEYRPVTGFCMCDFSMLRSHTKRLERAKTMGERLRHAKLVNYYTELIMQQRTLQLDQTYY
jgi:uncharacterized protein YacL